MNVVLNYVVIENIPEGIYNYDFKPQWFEWNKNKKIFINAVHQMVLNQILLVILSGKKRKRAFPLFFSCVYFFHI